MRWLEHDFVAVVVLFVGIGFLAFIVWAFEAIKGTSDGTSRPSKSLQDKVSSNLEPATAKRVTQCHAPHARLAAGVIRALGQRATAAR
jgi:hypothetical protein